MKKKILQKNLRCFCENHPPTRHIKYKVINFPSSNKSITANSGGGFGFRWGVGSGGVMWVQMGVGVCSDGGVQAGGVQAGVFRWGRAVQVVTGKVFRWGVQWGEGSKGANVRGLKGSEGANVRGIEGEQRGKRRSSTESFCNLSLGFEMN